MIEIKIWGYGGQGVVTAAQVLAIAAFYDKKYSQAFPMFGVERRGTPVYSFIRINNKPIKLRSQIYKPDYNILLDQRLLKNIKHGKLIVNTSKKIKNAYCFNANDLKFINIAMICTFAKFTNIVSKKSLLKAIKDKFKNNPELIKQNKKILEKIWK